MVGRIDALDYPVNGPNYVVVGVRSTTSCDCCALVRLWYLILVIKTGNMFVDFSVQSFDVTLHFCISLADNTNKIFDGVQKGLIKTSNYCGHYNQTRYSTACWAAPVSLPGVMTRSKRGSPSGRELRDFSKNLASSWAFSPPTCQFFICTPLHQCLSVKNFGRKTMALLIGFLNHWSDYSFSAAGIYVCTSTVSTLKSITADSHWNAAALCLMFITQVIRN